MILVFRPERPFFWFYDTVHLIFDELFQRIGKCFNHPLKAICTKNEYQQGVHKDASLLKYIKTFRLRRADVCVGIRVVRARRPSKCIRFGSSTNQISNILRPLGVRWGKTSHPNSRLTFYFFSNSTPGPFRPKTSHCCRFLLLI